MSTFYLFSSFPLEIQLMVWTSAVLDATEDKPELLIVDGDSDLELRTAVAEGAALGQAAIAEEDHQAAPPSPSQHEPSFRVHTSFPALLHATRDSRSVTLSHLQRHGFLRQVAASPSGTPLHLPTRPFRPALDGLFLRSGLAPLAAFTRIAAACPYFVKSIRHLVVDVWHFLEMFDGMWDMLGPVVARLPALRDVTVVSGYEELQARKHKREGDGDCEGRGTAGVAGRFGLELVVDELRDGEERKDGGIWHAGERLSLWLNELEEQFWMLEMDEQGPWDPDTGRVVVKFQAGKIVRQGAYE